MNDLIKRSDAIKAIDDKVNGSDNRLWLKEIISELPSADRPSGEWVQDTYGWVYCSHCKKYLDDYQMVFFLKPFDYCPNCGADMRGEL